MHDQGPMHPLSQLHRYASKMITGHVCRQHIPSRTLEAPAAESHLPCGRQRGADVRRRQAGEAADQQQHAAQALHVQPPGLGILQLASQSGTT